MGRTGGYDNFSYLPCPAPSYFFKWNRDENYFEQKGQD